jgi:hypothetical protein
MIFVPDELADEAEAEAYFISTLDEVSAAVAARLRKRRPSWPIDDLCAQIRALTPVA